MGQSDEISRFLRSKRNRVAPEDVGLPRTGGRRVPGLRREEVARLAGVSVDYYTRFEQGRNPRPSRAVVEAVAGALQLSADESAHLLDLVTNNAPRNRRPIPAQKVRSSVRMLLEETPNAATILLGRRFNVLATNELARLVFTDFSALPKEERNFTRWVLLDPAAQELFVDWERLAKDLCAALRIEAGRRPDDPEVDSLVGHLAVRSEKFRLWWAGHHVEARPAGVLRLHHPLVGPMELDYETLIIAADDNQRLRIHSARRGSPSADALKLLDSFRAGKASTVHEAERPINAPILPLKPPLVPPVATNRSES